MVSSSGVPVTFKSSGTRMQALLCIQRCSLTPDRRLPWVGGALFAKSTRQKLVTKSSTESELVGLSDSVPQIIWTRDFLTSQGYPVRAATIYQDNKSTICLAEKGRSTSERTRHINIRYFFVKDRIASGEVRVEYLPTQLMVADILTKPLQGELFRRLRDALLTGKDPSPSST